MKQSKHWMSLLVILFLFFTKVLFAGAEEEARIDKKEYPVFENISLIYDSKIYYPKAKLIIKTIFPTLLTENEMRTEGVDLFNQKVNALIRSEISNFKKQVSDNVSTVSESNMMDLDFDTATINAKKTHIISVRFSVLAYLSGTTHSKHYHRVFNFDMDEKKELSLADIFEPDSEYLTVLSEYSKKVLSRHLKDTDMIDQGTAPNAENFSNWNIRPEGLFLTFDNGQVAQDSEGTQTVLIPYAFLKGMIARDSPIAECVANKRRCMRNNLSTGGFIDEALNTRHRGFNKELS